MRLSRLLQAKRFVPINCRTPSPESTKVTGREKLEWAAYVVALTLMCGGVQLLQFYVTSAVNVNKGVGEELSRRRRSENSSSPSDSTV